jgi:iron complex outermembrane receptor protein
MPVTSHSKSILRVDRTKLFQSSFRRSVFGAIAGVISLSVLSLNITPVFAAEGDNRIEEMLVTAQKREESLNDVPMSVQAATGEQMEDLGVTDAFDLFKVATGFSSNVTRTGTAIYTIRGVGFQENSLATSPTVSVYLDEAPLQFSPMTRGASLDVQRVEVLKGPQGTLFGQNATGGAVNFIANKPTSEFEAGVNASFGRFNSTDLDGFVSGPINDTWSYRVAARIQNSDDWQKSYVNTDEAGERDEFAYRASVAYDNDDRLRLLFTLSGFTDQSDVLRPQLAGKISQNPLNGLPPGFAAAPLAPKNARAAAWSPCVNAYGGTVENPNQRNYDICEPLENDTDFTSAQVRIDYDLSDNLVLTSLTSYNDYNRKSSGVDHDGTTFQIYETLMEGELETFFQEVRVAGTYDKMNWVVGVNYENMDTYDYFLQSFGDSSVVPVFGFIDFGPNNPNNTQEVKTAAIYGNVEYSLSDEVLVYAGLRYTDQKRDFNGCTDDGGDGTWALTAFLIQPFLGSTNPVQAAPGECATTGLAPDFNAVPGGHTGELDEDNVSWRVGLNWFVNDDTMFYGNISKGYKNGQFPTVSGSAAKQMFPVVQEELLAYEIGAKATLANGSLQLNAALFYYDYTDKQLLGALEDATFGSLSALVNVPESHVQGGELVATWVPVAGLVISPSVSYADTETDGEFRNFDAFFKGGNTGTKDFSGQNFPQAPELQANLNISYSWEVSRGWTAFVGGNANYRESTTANFVDECNEPGVPCTKTDAQLISGDSDLPVPSRTLVDLRAGVENDHWKLWLWGRNVTDKYYWTSYNKVNDSIVRFAAMPRTYGLTLSYKN